MRINLRREHIPWVMAACRGVLGPVLIAGAGCSWNGVTLAGIVEAVTKLGFYLERVPWPIGDGIPLLHRQKLNPA
jgi:hypothetical protein